MIILKEIFNPMQVYSSPQATAFKKEAVVKVSKKDDVPGNAMNMKGEEKIKKLVYSGSNGKGSYEIKGNKLNVIGIRPRDKGFFVRHFTMGTGIRKANLYYDGVHWQGGKKFESVNEAMSDSEIKKMHKKAKETGELPPHLKKILKGKKDFEKKFKVKNIVVPGLEWMADIEEGSCGYSIDGEGDDEPAGPHLLKKIKKEDMDYVPAKWSSSEARLHMDADVKKMSKVLGKASYQIIKIMMDGVKGKRYDALDIIRGIDTGELNRTHDGERPFMKMLWRKVRNEFRRYLPKGKLRR